MKFKHEKHTDLAFKFREHNFRRCFMWKQWTTHQQPPMLEWTQAYPWPPSAPTTPHRSEATQSKSEAFFFTLKADLEKWETSPWEEESRECERKRWEKKKKKRKVEEFELWSERKREKGIKNYKFFTSSWTVRLQICNLTIAEMQNILGLHTRVWKEFMGLGSKIAIWGVFKPPMLVL